MRFIEGLGIIIGTGGMILGVFLGAEIVEALLGSATLYWWAFGLTLVGTLLGAIGEDL